MNENASLIKYEPPKCDECGRKIVVLSDLCAKCSARIELNGKKQASRRGSNPLPTCPKPPAPPNPPPDQPVQPDFSDAYQGAREDAEIWKKRALEAEELNRKFISDINGQTFMGEPAQPVQPAGAINAEHLEAMRKRFVKLPKYSFLLNASGGVSRVPDRSGNWVEWSEVHNLFDPVVADAAIAAAESAKGGV